MRTLQLGEFDLNLLFDTAILEGVGAGGLTYEPLADLPDEDREAIRAQLWAPRREDFLAEFVARRPGERPAIWWELDLDPPEPCPHMASDAPRARVVELRRLLELGVVGRAEARAIVKRGEVDRGDGRHAVERRLAELVRAAR